MAGMNQRRPNMLNKTRRGETRMSTVRQAASMWTQVQSGIMPWSTVFAVTAALLAGVFIVAGVGFAGPEVLHNAAHDLRHGLAFPCH